MGQPRQGLFCQDSYIDTPTPAKDHTLGQRQGFTPMVGNPKRQVPAIQFATDSLRWASAHRDQRECAGASRGHPELRVVDTLVFATDHPVNIGWDVAIPTSPQRPLKRGHCENR